MYNLSFFFFQKINMFLNIKKSLWKKRELITDNHSTGTLDSGDFHKSQHNQ